MRGKREKCQEHARRSDAGRAGGGDGGGGDATDAPAPDTTRRAPLQIWPAETLHPACLYATSLLDLVDMRERLELGGARGMCNVNWAPTAEHSCLLPRCSRRAEERY